MHQTKVVTHTRNDRVGVLEVVKVYIVGIKISKEQTTLFVRYKKTQYLKMETLHFCEKWFVTRQLTIY